MVQRNNFYLGCRVFVKARVDLPARLNVTEFLLPARINVFRTGFKDLRAHIYILAEMPGAVTNLQASLPEKTWQTGSSVTFKWDEPTTKSSPVERYHYSFSRTQATTPSLSWSSTVDRELTLNLTSSGVWYFAVAAKNTAGSLGPATVYQIWYNHAPSAPGAIQMTISGHDTILNRPHVACHPVPAHVLAWSAAIDIDAADGPLLRYEIQIATRSDFGVDPQNATTSIVRDYQNIAGTTFNWNDLPESGIYFWRIRANDAKQSSDWSGVGSFRINAPPGRPEGLTARQR